MNNEIYEKIIRKKHLIIHHPSGASFEKESRANRVKVKFIFLPFAKEGGCKSDGLNL